VTIGGGILLFIFYHNPLIYFSFNKLVFIQQLQTSYCRVSSKKKGLKKSDQTNHPTKSTQPRHLGDCRVEQSQNKSEQNSHNPTKTTQHLQILQDYVVDRH
tara:strand:+ start:241 stop:543 length:303 start_codon:yes stop_codon:yes gene_type:complete